MANTTFTKTLSLMAYENNLTPDIVDDYTLRVKTQSASLDVSAIAREVSGGGGGEVIDPMDGKGSVDENPLG